MSSKSNQPSRSGNAPKVPGEVDLKEMAAKALEEYQSYFKHSDLSAPDVRKRVFSSNIDSAEGTPSQNLTVLTFSPELEESEE